MGGDLTIELQNCFEIVVALHLTATLFLIWPYLASWAKTRATLRRLSAEVDAAAIFRILEFQCTIEDACNRAQSLDEKEALMEHA